MIANLNVRELGNGAVLVQYQEDGKAYDAGFDSWASFITWITATVRDYD